ncbi:LysR family transcriptional regulator [Xanthomonas hortorum]|uniref:HTH-type transcriptional regulator SyrM 1 n=1 Tax=Xanthomonas hortorum pv. pelargonii TaxID=453602 RepID=A0A6V7C0N5_9XANT|nr:LysR family transcriptional regulator [Xanthomonas hortorum]MCE4355484.1 LysR family transcriptional regulator [Xanthomonas hortorum pv. pelargonii]MCM5525298.1 LysR family transcriptional regulator [Xanthomonas hortorum pv. pelargonii]MCM5537820.1 LysR family transcriptional regulator [Xanthomonas hortorum pv. pelargonii]MCM5541962.1 LysR family transcriptional regulator [Xanthomonas hortorum pv. pelargonii]MCM5545468.1 LysR family transcriptional regulator [Xanthomonas hortorum pv. pelarg
MKDIKTLDLNLLKALDALLDEHNVTRAAARLGVTQPAMSGMLTRLRKTFDDPLFVRAQRGIVPTQRCLALAGPLKQVISEIGGLLQPLVFEPSTAAQTFTIAATDYALRAIAIPFLSALKQQAPHISVALVPVDDRQIYVELERGEIDLALLTPESTPPDLHARALFEERYVCVLRGDHPALQRNRKRLTIDQFCALDHALVSYLGGGFRGVTDEALAALGKHRRVTLSAQSFLILPEILRASDMVAILPSRLVAGIEGLATFEPPIAIPGFTKIAAWHARTHHDGAQRWLRQLLFDHCGDRATRRRR